MWRDSEGRALQPQSSFESVELAEHFSAHAAAIEFWPSARPGIESATIRA
jgi:hypothetical protein